MISIPTILIFTCIVNISVNVRIGRKGIFDETADDIFEAIVGQDTHKARKELESHDRKYFFDTAKLIYENKNHSLATTSTTKPNKQVTSLPKTTEKNTSLEEVKRKIRLDDLQRLLNNNKSLIPDFANNGDDPNSLTRRFDETPYPPAQDKEYLRQIYVDGGEDIQEIRLEKFKIMDLIRQFVYMTRYRMGGMTMLRRKYQRHLKYKIGYCMGLLRHVRHQQMMVYSEQQYVSDTMNSAYTMLMFYYKMMVLDVDINDLVRLLKRLHYHSTMLYNPEYYNDDTEEVNLARVRGKPTGQVPTRVTPPDHNQSPNESPNNLR